MSVTAAPSVPTRASPSVLAAAARSLQSLKILLPFAVLVAIWWGIWASGEFPENVLVSPLKTWDAFVHLTTHGVLAEYASTSVRMIGGAALISMAVGVPVGFLVGVNRYAAHALEGFLRFLQSISGIAWLPLAIIWFGFSHTTSLVIVIYSLIVPVIFNTMIGIAALISMAIGVPIGFAVGTNRYAAHSLEGFLRFLQSISGIAWLPLAIIWFGFSHTTTLVIVIYSLIVPIIFNTMIGVRAIPENYALALRSLGAGRLRLVTDVYLPGALPSIVVGLRLGMGYGWRALIAAEMLVRKGGLGDLIFGARTFGQIDRIIAGMITIGCLYIVVDRLIVQPIENITVARWGMLRK
jgi:NitT/TauT family transport system permease protein/taurine transport system permease protein